LFTMLIPCLHEAKNVEEPIAEELSDIHEQIYKMEAPSKQLHIWWHVNQLELHHSVHKQSMKWVQQFWFHSFVFSRLVIVHGKWCWVSINYLKLVNITKRFDKFLFPKPRCSILLSIHFHPTAECNWYWNFYHLQTLLVNTTKHYKHLSNRLKQREVLKHTKKELVELF